MLTLVCACIQTMVLFPDEDFEEIRFAEETEASPPQKSWKILIVDDEVEVHRVTQLALSDFTFEDRAIAFISAYSAQEAKHLIQAHSDIAIVLLDVVMESENAGLHLVKFIREDLKNSLVRIILRTGQPGQAPEAFVAVHYGIDDYKTKTELTVQKLFTTIVTALRGFSTLTAMFDWSQALEAKIIQHKQSEIELRMSEMDAIGKVQQLERALQELRQLQSQSEIRSMQSEVNLLDQLATSVTQEAIRLPNPENPLQTLSIITRIARSVLRITDEQTAKLGISQTKLAALIYLSSAEQQSASPSAIAKYCGVSRAAVTGLLDGLEQEGYVERDPHPSDRRALMVKLTDKGQRFFSLVSFQDHNYIAELVTGLDAGDRQKMNDLLIIFSQLLGY
ncbi:MAG TPA: MarR family transcriptional regulator [Leptolyngbya sp.]|nr:MarR family transcriptional regulator [Leptolyngbya sp.]